MIKPTTWNGTVEQFWDAIREVRGDRETEVEFAVLVDVLALARAYEGLRRGVAQGEVE
jgi:hypothetical protein